MNWGQVGVNPATIAMRGGQRRAALDGEVPSRRPFWVVEPTGLEPVTPCLQSRCAASCAMAPTIIDG